MDDHKPKVFWSWQSDYSPDTCRHFIRAALMEAIARIVSDIDVDDADRPEIDQDTRGARGMVDIAATILNKISSAAIFVADLTPIARSPSEKWLPNPNVMIELGWAMHKPGWERVIGVLNVASGASVEDLPFDIRHRRIVTFDLRQIADKAALLKVRAKLVNELEAAIRTNLQDRAEDLAADATIAGVNAKAGNYSIWSSAGETLTHNDAFGGAGRETVRMPDVPRAYMRVIPAGWKNGAPTISDIAGLKPEESVQAPSGGGSEGNYGATEEGFARYWITEKLGPQDFSSTDITMFFTDTGEFWMLHGSVVGSLQGQLLLRDEAMLAQWSVFLRKSLAVMARFKAQRVFRVEAGLHGVKDVHWYSSWRSERTPSRRNETREEKQSQEWGPEAQLTFLTSAYNRVLDLFARRRNSETETTQILRTYDPERFQQVG